ncbi:hypothetical protein LSO9J_90003 [Candidatus Liberibacter solanacearum]
MYLKMRAINKIHLNINVMRNRYDFFKLFFYLIDNHYVTLMIIDFSLCFISSFLLVSAFDKDNYCR